MTEHSTPTERRWITIFCGSSTGFDTQFTESAFELGKQLANNGFGLVYGGASIGVMGAVAEGFLQHKAPVIGVIPKILKKREVAHFHLTELIETETMHERKAIMMQRADAFLTLPGGFGTLEELFEVVTWKQLDIHQKPIFLFNQHGFYSPLLESLVQMSTAGFIQPDKLGLIHSIDDFSTLLNTLIRIKPANHNYSKLV